MHAIIEDRLNKAFARAEMVLDSVVIALFGLGGDLAQRDPVDPLFCKKRLCYQQHLRTAVEILGFELRLLQHHIAPLPNLMPKKKPIAKSEPNID